MTYKRQKTSLKSRSCRFTFFPYPSIILYIEIDKEREIVMARIIYQTECEIEGLAEEIDFAQALRIVKNFMCTDDTLDALKGFEKRYEKAEIDIDLGNIEHLDLGWDWRYEIYAYNLLVEGFSKLFAPKEA